MIAKLDNLKFGTRKRPKKTRDFREERSHHCVGPRRQRGPITVRALGLHAVVPADSTPPRFVNSQLVASCQLGF